MAITRKCGAPVPEALKGNLSPSHCTRQVNASGQHDSEHKAHLNVKNIGRLVFTWRNHHRPERQQPPVITLPVPHADHLNPKRGSYQA